MAETWGYLDCTLARVIDGDTFVANVQRTKTLTFHVTAPASDFGFHVGSDDVDATFEVAQTMSSQQRFRLNRAAAAPVKTLSGLGAAMVLAELLSAAPFSLASVGPYKFGDEWMAEVTLRDGRNLTDVLVKDQWVASWNGRGAQPLPPWPRTVE